MRTYDHLRKVFSGAELELSDLYLLESFQISYLPGWVSESDFACVIEHNPGIAAFFEKKYPPIAEFISRISKEYSSAGHQANVHECVDRLLWTIADLLVYNSCPEVYDSLKFHSWDFAEITDIASLEGMTVIDAGAGTGRAALQAAEYASVVYAVEPVTRLRQFIREKASSLALSNLYTVDGFLHDLPFPDSFADVLITSHALGWKLEEELPEFERVVKKGGFVIHCPGTAVSQKPEEIHEVLISPEWNYRFKVYSEADGDKIKYWKTIKDSCPMHETEI